MKKVAWIIIAIGVAGSLFMIMKFNKPTSQPIASSGGEALNITLKDFAYYIQNDPKWGDLKIGETKEYLSDVDCTLTCSSMALDCLGIKLAPDELNKQLTTNKGFTRSGWLIWSALENVANVEVELSNNPSYQNIDQTLKSGIPVIVKIQIDEKYTHWVLIIGKKGKEYLIKDPLDRRKRITKISEQSSKIYATRIIFNNSKER